MERGYSSANSPEELLARHYNETPYTERIEIPPIDLNERRSEGHLERRLSGDELDHLQHTLGLED
jgi:hypothetical protein